ncbi:MAG: hypothetical protein AAF813_12255, partial [Pseudomonadota bacterium]
PGGMTHLGVFVGGVGVEVRVDERSGGNGALDLVRGKRMTSWRPLPSDAPAGHWGAVRVLPTPVSTVSVGGSVAPRPLPG